MLCIWDGGGTDTIDLSGFKAAARIDLHDGSFSDVGGYVNNLSIAVGCVIENASGGKGSDQITGNAAANRLLGLGGNDTLDGGAGNDTLVGGAGADRFDFARGDGVDRVADFNVAQDFLHLTADLWGGVVKTAAEVVSQFSGMRGGHVVLDFGADELHLMTLTTTAGLADHILIA